jgi:hypothetical protein
MAACADRATLTRLEKTKRHLTQRISFLGLPQKVAFKQCQKIGAFNPSSGSTDKLPDKAAEGACRSSAGDVPEPDNES